jgi:hypothetical protein
MRESGDPQHHPAVLEELKQHEGDPERMSCGGRGSLSAMICVRP